MADAVLGRKGKLTQRRRGRGESTKKKKQHGAFAVWNWQPRRTPNERGQKQNYRGNEAAIDWRAEVCAPDGEGSTARFEAEKQGIAARFIREVAAGWAACGPFEWVALAYLAVSGALITMFAETLRTH